MVFFVVMNMDNVLRAYKKRQKALQRRISIKKDVNKRLVFLLKQCNLMIPEGLLKDMVKHELEMLQYKYY